MEIHFFGAVRTTTGSMHMISANGRKVLLDCGLYQGKRKEAFERNRNLPFDPRSVDAVVLSHAHIDHSGNLPTLVKRGFRGNVHATSATVDLCDAMLHDSAHLQVSDVEYVNRSRRAEGKNLFEPLYVPEDVDRLMDRFTGLPYNATREVADGVRITLHDAGHILGSAIMQIDVAEGGVSRRVVFTGDLGRANMPILRDPEAVLGASTLITESTYGGRMHESHAQVEDRLAALVNEVRDKRSKLIIPAFSVGRTQEILYLLNNLYAARRLGAMPVYVDSPLAHKATDVYEHHTECYDAETLALLRSGDLPFSFPRLNFTADAEASKALNRAEGPMVIIAASGMCEGGRIVHHLKHGVGDARNVVLFVGFQAENTLGRYLVEGRKVVRILGEECRVAARVERIDALSAHADQGELLAYFRSMGAGLERAYVVHGELDGSQALAAELTKLGVRHVEIPTPGEAVAL